MKTVQVIFLIMVFLLNSVWGRKTEQAPATSVKITKRTFSESDRGSRVSWCRLKFPVFGSSKSESTWDWHNHPSGDVKMIHFLREYTSINLKQEWNVVDIKDLDKMCAFPLIFMHGQRLINIDKKSEDNLKEYILRGGFLLIDDCVYNKYYAANLFYRSMVKKLTKLLPGAKFKGLIPPHELFRCYFVLDHWPHMQGRNNGVQAVYYKKRLIAFLYSSDLHCGWVDVGWFSPTKTRNAFRMGTNLYIYAMNH